MANDSFTAWQTCLPTNLPTLFYAFDHSQQQTERVAAFKIFDQNELQSLLDSQPQRLKITIGADPAYDFTSIPSDPAVRFFLDGLSPQNGDMVRIQFDWDPNPPFLEQGAYSPDSGPNEIPAEGAILFAIAWLETKYDDISSTFEGVDTTHNLVQRVKSYIFQEDETTTILGLLADYIGAVDVCLYLGNSIPVSKHPFGFRPVLEILPTNKSKRANVLGGGNGHFFDFSNPCPPFCDQ